MMAEIETARESHNESPVSTETRNFRAAADFPVKPLPSSVIAYAGTLKDRRRFYEAMVEDLKEKYKVAIRKWRSTMSGVAYELKYRDGRIKRLITAPRPRSPVSAAIFLHEVGHHAIGFRRYSPRCLEEFYVWQWAFREMKSREIPVDPRVIRHFRRSMFHYVRMARKRGLTDVPQELHEFLIWPG